ncbi:venom allergen 5-like [Halictus rubicundus]|uniref:venom allergen 5-like n=1 Tax=Halictus rubicundus TaxID=77578 RepID=UPI004036DFB8
MVPGGYTIPIMVTFIVALMDLADGTKPSCDGNAMIKSGGLTCKDKQDILDTHNELRQFMAVRFQPGQPQAANMREMFWDDKLANDAQRFANLCPDAYSGSEHDDRFPVSQLMGKAWAKTEQPYGDKQMWPIHIYKWFSLVHKYTGIYKSEVSPFIQVVWADTYLVGCGYSNYYSPKSGYQKRHICNYGPGFKTDGKPYISGPPNCSSYGMTDSSRYWGLCVKGSDCDLENHFTDGLIVS